MKDTTADGQSVVTEPDSEEAKQLVIRGVAAYSIRQIIVTGLNMITGILLTRLLHPQDFGYIAIVGLASVLVSIMTESGLSVYLIQRQEDATNDDLSATASLQLVIYSLIHATALFVFLFLRFLKVNTFTIRLLLVSLSALPFSIFRGSSLVILQRRLSFRKIAIIEIMESFSFTLVALSLAALGLGPWCVVAALLARALVGCQISRLYARWRFTFSIPEFTQQLRTGIRFGVNYHLPSLIQLARLAVNPIAIGSLLSIKDVGIADRAVYLAGLPLSILAPVQKRILFPYVAKMQSRPEVVRSILEKSVYACAMMDKLFYLPLVLFGSTLVGMFFPSKWLAVVPLMNICMIGNLLFGAFSPSAVSILNGLGKPETLVRLSLFNTVLSWILVWPLIRLFGLVGYAYISLLLWSGTVYLYIALRKYTPRFLILRPLFIPAIAFGMSYGVTRLVLFKLKVEVETLSTISLFSVLSICACLLVLVLLDRKAFVGLLSRFRRSSP